MDIIPRKILSQPQTASPKYWYDNKAFETHFFNALSSTFPEGERFFIISVRNYAAQITDPKLKEQVERFISQEGQHSREHEAHLKLLADQGFA
ncbi:MAG: metal-dependent hydrolase, partial [Pontibacterium sp.]